MKNFLIVAVLSALVSAIVVYHLTPAPKQGNVITQGIIGRVSTSSLATVGPGNATIIAATSTACTARIISSVSQPLMLSFSPLITPTGLFGHVQAASTTIAYENATYGCGPITAFGFGASTTITVTTLIQ